MSLRTKPRRLGLSRALVPRALALGAALALVAGLAPVGWAQSDHSTVVRVLRHGRDFRARVRAALALGSSDDQRVTPHLVEALDDSSPAVRAAAATALGRLGDASALPALRGAARDRRRVVRNEAQRAIRRIRDANRDAAGSRRGRSSPRRQGGSDRYPNIAVVPRAREIYWPRVRYVVVLGSMENRSDFGNEALAGTLAREVSRGLLVLRGVAVLREGREPPEAAREIRRRNLPKLRLEGSVNTVERNHQRRQLQMRCEVSLMLMEEPGRELRSVLNGAATGSQPRRRGRRQQQERELAQQALTGAVRSAMSGAARAIASAGRH
ncbi:MAG TPA: HEAT repeat domain-containing protein [Sandaracinaceae bacterium LLY-WYZ-13_1]|nr:HEAT repeat domain-containing protein [Sandaracinaceae bacterium LLY-WYZ-13_1]